jgi:hypothetical protein
MAQHAQLRIETGLPIYATSRRRLPRRRTPTAAALGAGDEPVLHRGAVACAAWVPASRHASVTVWASANAATSEVSIFPTLFWA